MFISVILAHPHPGSFNHAVAETVVAALTEFGHTVAFHDLYAEKFDPLLPYPEIDRDARLPSFVAEHCREIAAADGLVIVHPNWWGMPPAVMKGWIDRVLRPGVAYRFREGDAGEGVPEGLLKAKAALVLNTSNTPEQRELDVFGDPLERLWKDCVCMFCGIPVFRRRMFGVVVTSTLEQRQSWLDEAFSLTREVFPPGSA
ncbi:MAG TPA: NAD(P)H-dependent oxidoreductase [Methanoregulaceae archaeon]|nr:NAD(P)H-dependent oxidoreductase [Methanolinea sp.]MDD3092285.1 NAD(P)H-dependent oxidoreductase [Methanoregulaceae archaeon]HQC13313.1 NAD(P)H-dependent oxidoreductase [Methanoregulaceae archaeon]